MTSQKIEYPQCAIIAAANKFAISGTKTIFVAAIKHLKHQKAGYIDENGNDINSGKSLKVKQIQNKTAAIHK